MTEDRTACPLRHPDRFFINGEWAAPSSDATIDVINPATEELYVRVAEAAEADIDRAVAAARAAFDTGPWPRMTPAERAAVMRRISAEVTRRQDELAAIHSCQAGVTFPIARLLASSRFWDYYADLADSFPFIEKGSRPEAGGNHAFITREAVGVVGAIIPWNVPMGLITMKCAPALLAGCTVVLKASPEAPGEALLTAEIMEAVGVPPGVFNVLTADRDVSEMLVRHRQVDKITFTGSTAAGRKIGAICGGRIARATLELGGKSPAVILDDYDVGKAAATIAAYAPMMTGQVCSSLTRIIVSRPKHDALVEALVESFKTVRIGDPFDADVDMGPLAMRRQRDRVEGYFAKGQAEGATLATGGGRPAHLDRGFYVEPTVFGHVTNDMTIAREEIFGPVLSVIPVDSEAQAIAVANDTPFGLNASVFTGDPDRFFAVARQIRSGGVGHNSYRGDFSLPFGGFKQSGIGREGGVDGLKAFLETKTVIMDEVPPSLSQLG